MNDALTVPDLEDRRRAMTATGATLLVEAGAGTGKTSLLAGRIVKLLAEGVEPRSIAAVTFTELAAAELQERVREFVQAVAAARSADDVSVDVRPAFPQGPTDGERARLEACLERLDEMACSTIHGFCQRLLKPFPVEARMDPGARILDAANADLLFMDCFRDWLWEKLDADRASASALTFYVSRIGEKGVKRLERLAGALRDLRGARAPDPGFSEATLVAFADAADEFAELGRALGFEAEGHGPMAAAMSHAAAEARECAELGGWHGAVRFATTAPGEALVRADGGFRAYRLKTKWKEAGGKAGAEANERATALFAAATELFARARGEASGRTLAALVEELGPMVEAYDATKRAKAYLDFGDLLEKARELLRSNPDVARHLGGRYPRILVDEFQDTDPVQCEIFMRLATDPSDGDPGKAPLRPGSLFLVGDPKQAIYRFRGGDVETYAEVRERFRHEAGCEVLGITTNFRSRPGVLACVNAAFDGPLSAAGQPGFAPLDAFRPDEGVLPAVMRYGYEIDEGETAVDAKRKAEAAAVAGYCRSLIGWLPLPDGKGGTRKCLPSDIALLAPTGTGLEVYEDALEEIGVSVASQAGKGVFTRQEVKDLIAVARILAEPRDTLALGAFLRGPLVGATEADMLAAAAEVPGGRLRLGLRPAGGFSDPAIERAMTGLESLRAMAEEAEPYHVMAQAVETFRMFAAAAARRRYAPDRAVANIDRFLEFARPYGVRGMRQFADRMREHWEQAEREVEGRPDGEKHSVSLVTMHSSKGLEWPVVIPVNLMTAFNRHDEIVTDVRARMVSMPVVDGAPPEAHLLLKSESERQDHLERTRVWYVAATRARDCLLLCEHPPAKAQCWATHVDMGLEDLPWIGSAGLAEGPHDYDREMPADAPADAQAFAMQARAIAARPAVRTVSPSRQEHAAAFSETASIDLLAEAVPDLVPAPAGEASTGAKAEPMGGRARGDVLHRLMEEAVTGETAVDGVSLAARASELAMQYAAMDPEAPALDPGEMAATAARTLSIPEVAAMLGRLVPELPAYGYEEGGDGSVTATFGVVDAAEMVDGRVATVVDWKSDVDPDASAAEAYADQVRSYLELTGAKRGLIVFMTPGTCVEVFP